MALLTGSGDDRLSEREAAVMAHEREMTVLYNEQARIIKDKEVNLTALEAKWASWLRIPKILIMLPVYILFGLGYLVHAFRKSEPSDRFWDLLR